MSTRRIIIVLHSEGPNALSEGVPDELPTLGIDNIRRSDDSGLPVVTGTVPDGTDMGALLQTLNGMPAVRNAEEDSFSFNQ